jgi:hypothetical protein
MNDDRKEWIVSRIHRKIFGFPLTEEIAILYLIVFLLMVFIQYLTK